MFKLDSPLMNFLNKVADIMILNVLFLIFSIPFFTIGAAFSAAYYMGFKMVKNEETYIVRGFWKAFKDNFKQGTIIWLLLVVVLGILTVDFRIILYSGIEFAQWIRIAMIAVTFVILLGVMFLFPLQARFINPVKNTIKNAFFDGTLTPPNSIFVDCHLCGSRGSVLLYTSEFANYDTVGVWAGDLSEVFFAAARVQAI